MRYLIIAKDLECRKYIELMHGTDKQISEYTVKKKNSEEIRLDFKKQIKMFQEKYKDTGDIVIVDDALKEKRIKVLYKKDKVVFKNVILNKKFIVSTFKSWLYKIYTEADRVDIKSFNGKSYETYIKKCFNSKKDRDDYYDIVRKINSLYRDYIKDKPYLETPNEIYLRYLEEKKEQLKNTKKNVLENNLEQNFYMQVLDIYEKGGIEEVLLYYSIDELYFKLNKDELISIGLGKVK